MKPNRSLCLLLALALISSTVAPLAHADETTAENPPQEASSASSETLPFETTSGDPEPFDPVPEPEPAAEESPHQTETAEPVPEPSESATNAAEEATTTPGASESETQAPSTDSGTVETETDIVATSTPLESVSTSSESTAGTSTEAVPESDVASSTGVSTGNASAGANIVNVSGSTFVNAGGEVVLENEFDHSNGVDLRTASSSFSTGELCAWLACTANGTTTILSSGTSTLLNLLALSATSGDNHIAQASGSAAILTGDAFVGLNLVNLANLNVVNSQYFIAALNFFQGLTGDIVFPSLTGFFDSILSSGIPNTIELNPETIVTNDLTFDTATGDNQTNATSSSISTGAARNLATVVNQLNSSLIGGASLAIILRITGAWDGDIFGAPEGLTVARGTDGSIYLSASQGGEEHLTHGSVSASTTALIENHAYLGAQTGDNSILNAENAEITTGEALAAANVLNFANQNIIGRNWLTAVVNIFGDWQGNLVFGRPDLWVGERAEAPGSITEGSELVLYFTVMNKGDSPATNAVFTPSLDTNHLELMSGTVGARSLGTLAPGQSVELAYTVRVHAEPGAAIETSGTVAARETDANISDNTDTLVIRTAGGGGRSSVIVLRTGTDRKESQHSVQRPLVVTRATRESVAIGTSTVRQQLTVTNPNDATTTPLDLHDLLRDPEGTVINDEAWALGALAPHEEVTVSYEIGFTATAPTGTYQFTTILVSDVIGDTTYRDNGSIVMSQPVEAITELEPSAANAAIDQSTLTEAASTTVATTDSSEETLTNPLLAAAVNASVAWPYAAGFAGASSALAAFLGGVLWMRRRYFGV